MSRIEIIPAIDLIGGHCVRLTKGEYNSEKRYDSSPVEMALAYAECGIKRIHIVDLDGAKLGRPSNLSVLEEIKRKVNIEIEWGGGISSQQTLVEVFESGADYAIIGSVAALKPELMELWLDSELGDKIILGADIKNGKIAVKGWTETAAYDIQELVQRFDSKGLKNVICTDVSKDGMLEGPSFELYKELQQEFPHICFTVSGGVSSMDDIKKLDQMGLRKAIVGKAIYENIISLQDIKLWSLNV